MIRVLYADDQIGRYLQFKHDLQHDEAYVEQEWELTFVSTPQQAIEKLNDSVQESAYDICMLDHDFDLSFCQPVGSACATNFKGREKEPCGMDIAKHLAEVLPEFYADSFFICHSWNPDARKYMHNVLKKAGLHATAIPFNHSRLSVAFLKRELEAAQLTDEKRDSAS